MSQQWNERRRAFEASLDIKDDQFIATTGGLDGGDESDQVNVL